MSTSYGCLFIYDRGHGKFRTGEVPEIPVKERPKLWLLSTIYGTSKKRWSGGSGLHVIFFTKCQTKAAACREFSYSFFTCSYVIVGVSSHM